MNNTAGLVYGILRKESLLFVRYKVNTLAYLVSLYAIFLMIFLGGRAVGGADVFGSSLGAIIVGYFLMTMTFTAFKELANTFTREASWGTLEQLYMCSLGFRRTTAIIAFTRVFLSFVIAVAVLALMLLTTGETLSLDVASALPVIVLAVTPVVGLGFLFGGLAIVYKRIDNLFSLMQFGVIGLIAAPVESYPALKVLPLTQASYLLRLVMNEGYSIAEIPGRELAVLVAVSVAYLAVGWFAFERLVQVARDRGVMGHY